MSDSPRPSVSSVTPVSFSTQLRVGVPDVCHMCMNAMPSSVITSIMALYGVTIPAVSDKSELGQKRRNLQCSPSGAQRLAVQPQTATRKAVCLPGPRMF